MALPSDLIGRILLEVADSKRQRQEAFGAATGSVLHIKLAAAGVAGAPALTQDDRVGEQARRGEGRVKELAELARVFSKKHKLPPGNLSSRVFTPPRAARLSLIDKQ